ncbi:MAG TPA: membrane dipeptidase, partial [Alphaproteobacteria bacterium]|nr:membrane dipeptidase [Alphaproteobacteria bacterium]
MTDAMELHRDALVIDSLVYHADGWPDDLRAGGIDAINVTACNFECDFEQACSEIARWHERFAQPDSAWMQIETVSDFATAKAAGKIGAILGWQNTRPIADRIDRLYFFYKLGLRIMQLTYNYRNMIGDGCLEPEGAGLTTYGREVVQVMNDLGIAIDLSHVGYRTAMDTIEASERPCLVTHANAHALTPLARNKPDDLIKALTAKGGYIGASIYGPMNWDGDEKRKPTIDDYLHHVDYLCKVAGAENVGFGTDLSTGADLPKIAFERTPPRRWEGINSFNRIFGEAIPERYLAEVRSHADLPKITDALLKRGWPEHEIRGYLG